MELWVFLTFGAVTFQTIRFMLQKHLSKAALSAGGATFARFLYAAPLVTLASPFVMQARGAEWPSLSLEFWLYAWSGGAAQILATVFIVMLFKSRNFAVGITFKKTEVLMTVLVGLVLLGEGVSMTGLGAILLGLAGVLVLSDVPGGQGGWLRRVANRAAFLGVASGLLFAVSGVCYRGASLEIASDDPLIRAMITLVAVSVSQLIVLGVYLRIREAGEIGRVLSAWRGAMWIGLTSLGGSMCWFMAFTLQNAAYVNAVGQSEVILSLLASYIFFRERLTLREGVGIGLITASVLALILLL